MTDQELQKLFADFGQITYVNRSHQTSAFIQFVLRRDALMAMRQMQGVPIYSCRLRISWGDPKPKSQWDFGTKNGRLPFKGNKHQHQHKHHQKSQAIPQHGYQNVWPQQWNQHQGFNNMPGPWNQQYQMPRMAYAPVQDIVWHHVQGHPSPEPKMPQSVQSSRPFSFDPSAASWKGNLKGKGPVVVSSDMVPNPYKQAHQQQAPEIDSTSSLETSQTDAS